MLDLVVRRQQNGRETERTNGCMPDDEKQKLKVDVRLCLVTKRIERWAICTLQW